MADKTSKFRLEFKRYKQKKPPPDFTQVIDFENQNSWKGIVKGSRLTLPDVNKQDLINFGLKSLNTWKCYELEGYQGFKVIANPFTEAGQLQWVLKCLKVYPCKPNICNLDAHMERSSNENLWELYEENQSKKVSCSSQQCLKKCQTLLDQLRWVTLGYHYNWDSKLYSKDNFTIFPCDLENFTKFVAKLIGFPNFVPEAAIVNYYHMDSTLSGHTDHSELDLTAPLFSISFGQACIFLLGSKTLDDVPCAMFLRSGDIVVMSHETRLAYHAVPRILPDDNLTNTLPTLDKEHETIGNYLSYSRININIRQVEGPAGCFPERM